MNRFEKIAYNLQPHQQRVIDKLNDHDAVLAYHTPGSGKTLTSIAAADHLHKKLTVIGPAAIKYNFNKEKLKHGLRTKIRSFSYNKPPTDVGDDLLVYDESHSMGNVDTQRSKLVDKLKSEKELLLTATPIKNSPDELIPILRSLGAKVPRDKKAFNDEYIREEYQNPGFIARVFRGIKPGVVRKAQHLDKLEKMLKGKVDYYKATPEGYPTSKEKDIVVEMTKEQESAYDMAIKQHPSLAYKVGKGIAPSKSESNQMNAFLTASRQISNIPGSYNLKSDINDAPKIIRAAKEIAKHNARDKNYRGVTYSQFKGHGTVPLGKILEKMNIPHGSFYGDMSATEKENVIKDYNSGKIKHLLISGAGSQGVDLRGTKLLQVLEPSWNEPNLQQVKGRAIRYKSHEALPEGERNVEIQNFVAVPREHGILFWKKRRHGTDEYLRMMARQKSELNNQFLDMLKHVGSDNSK